MKGHAAVEMLSLIAVKKQYRWSLSVLQIIYYFYPSIIWIRLYRVLWSDEARKRNKYAFNNLLLQYYM